MPGMGMNLPLDRMDVLDRGEIQMLAPDERFQIFQKLRARRHVARALPRFDPRRPLPPAFAPRPPPPFLPLALIIEPRRLGRDRDLRGACVRAQPQVDTEDVA